MLPVFAVFCLPVMGIINGIFIKLDMADDFWNYAMVYVYVFSSY